MSGLNVHVKTNGASELKENNTGKKKDSRHFSYIFGAFCFLRYHCVAAYFILQDKFRKMIPFKDLSLLTSMAHW